MQFHLVFCSEVDPQRSVRGKSLVVCVSFPRGLMGVASPSLVMYSISFAPHSDWIPLGIPEPVQSRLYEAFFIINTNKAPGRERQTWELSVNETPTSVVWHRVDLWKSFLVCWIWPRVWTGRVDSVVNLPCDIHNALHRSHLSDCYNNTLSLSHETVLHPRRITLRVSYRSVPFFVVLYSSRVYTASDILLPRLLFFNSDVNKQRWQ